MVWLFDNILIFFLSFGFKYLATYTCNCPSITTFKKDIDPNNNSSLQRFSHLEIPTKYQYMICIIISVLMGRFLYTIIDVDDWYTCIPMYPNPTLIQTEYGRPWKGWLNTWCSIIALQSIFKALYVVRDTTNIMLYYANMIVSIEIHLLWLVQLF